MHETLNAGASWFKGSLEPVMGGQLCDKLADDRLHQHVASCHLRSRRKKTRTHGSRQMRHSQIAEAPLSRRAKRHFPNTLAVPVGLDTPPAPRRGCIQPPVFSEDRP